MSATLNQNEKRYVSWKGPPTKLLTPGLAKNINTMNMNRYNLRLALPLKIYRKEIASIKNCDSKRIKIDDLNQPGGSNITVSTNELGSILTYDLSLPNSKYELLGAPCPGFSTNRVCLTIEQNAKTRVRSSGNIKRKFNVNANNDLSYYTNTKQYLEARNRLFTQNQYAMAIKNSATTKPGAPGSEAFLYKTNEISHCADYYLANPIKFSYLFPTNQALFDAASNNPNDTIWDVVIPSGYYSDVEQINTILKNTMLKNKHYYKDKTTGQNIFLLNISYDYIRSNVAFQTKYSGVGIYSNSSGNVDVSGNGISLITEPGTAGFTTVGPSFIIDTQSASEFLGFATGNSQFQTLVYPNNNYPAAYGSARRYNFMRRDSPYIPGSTDLSGKNSTDYGISTPPFMQKKYTPLYYKPNNSQYAQQGAVSASSKIARVRYNTITTNALKYRTSLGESVGNALAYGVSDTIYSLKDKIGFPNKKTPKFSPYTTIMKTCDVKKI